MLLVLLVLSIMPLYFPFVVDSGVIDPPRNLTLQHELATETTDLVSLTWTSRNQTDPLPVQNNSVLSGDHVILTSVWDVPVLSSRMTLSRGFNETRTGLVPAPIYEDAWPTLLCRKINYSMELFEGIHEGDRVDIALNMSSNGDPAFDVMLVQGVNPDDNITEVRDGGTLLFMRDDYGGGGAESLSFIANESYDIAVFVYCWAWAYVDNMTYDLSVSSLYSITADNGETDPSRIRYDTYYEIGNSVFNVTLESWEGTERRKWEYRNLSFVNYFAPDITVLDAIDLGGDMYNITWLSVDPNEEDTNYFSVSVSYDGGQTYYLLAQNHTDSFFVWDSTGFLTQDYHIRIKAYSLDFSNPICRVDHPPSSYWPGDFSTASILLEAGDGPYDWWIPLPSTLSSPADISYTVGSIGNQIVWIHSDSYLSSYPFVVTKDGVNYKSGYSVNRRIVVSIDDLPIGRYEFEVTMFSLSDTVLVQVVPLSDTLSLADTALLSGIARGVSLGSAIVILMSIVSINRLVRRKKFEAMTAVEPLIIVDPSSILLTDTEDS
ncbi:MAG: hypothetical protein ACFFF9_11750 [Candidatus Thorarchaeota archaeon]